MTETGAKGVIAGQEGVAGCGSEVTGIREKVRGHLVDRKRMATNGFEEVGILLEGGTERQNVTVKYV